ncbi:MAG: PAS domain S-box protein, partial [Rhodoferax sp.]|nr:PAS domain S-box protein [Rhodoferax sp.]
LSLSKPSLPFDKLRANGKFGNQLRLSQCHWGHWLIGSGQVQKDWRQSMKRKIGHPRPATPPLADAAGTLRARAEARLQQHPAQVATQPEGLAAQAMQEMLHELQVHQIELEMQNDELRRTQQALNTQLAHFFGFYELAPVGYCSIDEDGLIRQVNLTASSLLGRPRSELINRPVSRFILKEDQDIYYQLRRRLQDAGQSLSCEVRMVKSDGTLFWAHMTTVVAQDDRGAPLLRMVINNITERKLAEKALQESESRFRSLMENIPGVAVQGYALDGTVSFWNPASERLYGYSATEALGANLLDLIIPHDMHGNVRMAMQQMAATRQAIPAGELMLKTKAGTLVPVFSSHALVQPVGRAPELFCLDIDLSERNRAQTALRQSEAFKNTILNSVAAEIVVIDSNGVILATNQRWRQLALENGPEPGQAAPHTEIGSNYLAVCAAGTDATAHQTYHGILAVLQGRLPSFRLEYPCHSPGRQRWFNMVVMPLGEASPTGASITHTDITPIRQAAEQLRASESHLRAIFDTALDAMISMDAQGRITDWNLNAQALFGWHKDEVLGLNLHDTIAPAQYRTAHQQGLARFLATGQSHILRQRIEVTGLRRSGQEFPVALSVLPFKTGDGYQFTAFVADISERKDKEAKLLELTARLQQSEAHYRLLTENVSDIVWKLDRDSRFTYISPADQRLRGYLAEEVIGHHAFEFMTEEGIAVITEINRQLSAADLNRLPIRSITFEAQQRCKDGELIWTETLSVPECNADGVITGYHGISRNITDRKRMEDQVHQLAFFDPLTQLPNRRMLHDRLSQTMALSKRSGRHAAVMVLDLDNFKPLNDLHGHLVGDLLLIEVARRLCSCVREVDTVARFGGDEFVVVLGELDEDRAESAAQARLIAEKIRTTLAVTYVLTIMHEGQPELTVTHHCSASIGVVLFVNHEAMQEDVLERADQAMYQAKDAGRNLIRFFEADKNG